MRCGLSIVLRVHVCVCVFVFIWNGDSSHFPLVYFVVSEVLSNNLSSRTRKQKSEDARKSSEMQ